MVVNLLSDREFQSFLLSLESMNICNSVFAGADGIEYIEMSSVMQNRLK